MSPPIAGHDGVAFPCDTEDEKLYTQNVTTAMTPASDGDSSYFDQSLIEQSLIAASEAADSRRPSGMEDQVSPLMESLRLSVVEPFNALDQTMAKQEAVIGRETDGAGDNSPPTALPRVATIHPVTTFMDHSADQALDHSLPKRVPLIRTPSPAIAVKKRQKSMPPTLQLQMPPQVVETAPTPATSDTPDALSPVFVPATPSTPPAVSMQEFIKKSEKFHLMWAYDTQGTLHPVCKSSQTHGVSMSRLEREIRRADSTEDKQLEGKSLLQELSPEASHHVTDAKILYQIQTTFHHDFKRKLDEAILPQFDNRSPTVMGDGSLFKNYHLMSWHFKPRSTKTPSEGPSSVAVFNGPPRVLEIGCSSGNWIFKLKREHPSWLVEGLDDTDEWSRVHTGLSPRDFLQESNNPKAEMDYFHKLPSTQHAPEFTVRNINHLIAHEKPLPHNLYDMVRGRDVFDRVENYKAFLEDVRSILQPDGVVEFLEIDPRPRLQPSLFSSARSDIKDHKSGLVTHYTRDIADRFKEPVDVGLAEAQVPGWFGRVLKRLEGRVRPLEAIAAPNLKSWIEDAGFWDVKQQVWCIPVGGESRSGKLLRKLFLEQLKMEDSIPQLKQNLPKVEIEELESGKYHINLHIVTGRKPSSPRAGDLLLDESRQEMTQEKYEAMTRGKVANANHWSRMEGESSLAKMLDGLDLLPGSPQYEQPPELKMPMKGTKVRGVVKIKEVESVGRSG